MSSLQSKVCYVSAFYDLKREGWKCFARSFDVYLKAFEPIINLFSHQQGKQFELILYIDIKHHSLLVDKTKDISSIRLVPIDEQFMNMLPIWQRLDREREIMASASYKSMIRHRQHCPETYIPEYTLINHCKIDFISHAIDNNLTDANYLLWVDFGYCQANIPIPTNFIDLSKLDLNRINYTLINSLDENDKNYYYTLIYAPERIGGFFFFGNKETLKSYQVLYHSLLKSYQEQCIADDDQAIAVACYWKQPNLFCLHGPWGWHRALANFQLP